MSDKIERIYSNTIDPILRQLVSKYEHEVYCAERGKKGPFNPLEKEPKYRRSITVSRMSLSIHVTIFYSDKENKVLVGPVLSHPHGRFEHIELENV